MARPFPNCFKTAKHDLLECGARAEDGPSVILKTPPLVRPEHLDRDLHMVNITSPVPAGLPAGELAQQL